MRLPAPLDKFRFWMSCKLYKNPVLLPAAFLLVGGAIGAFPNLVHTPGASAHPTGASAATHAAARQQVSQERKLRELSIELSRLQARADRLDALGQQWVDAAGLEKAGFDFGEAPGQGGGDNEDAGEFERLGLTMIASDLRAMEQQYDLLEKQLQILDHWEDTVGDVEPGIAYASPGGGYQTSGFGGRYDPFGRGKRFHSGIDLAARVGDPVMAMAPGKVVFAGWQGGYGNLVEIEHEGGYHTRYAHNSKLIVAVGQHVETGTMIAKAGSTGRSTGAHLHIEVLAHGQQVNPRPFLERGRRVAAEQRKLIAKLAQIKPATPIRGERG